MSEEVLRGEKLFNARCAQCHTAWKGGANKIGPNLYGIFGRKSGSVSGYSYSIANKNAGKFWEAIHYVMSIFILSRYNLE